MHPALYQLRPYLKRIRKPRARRRQIESPSALCPKPVLHQASRRRKEHIRRHRRHNNDLDLTRVHTASRQAVLRRLHRQVARTHTLVHNVPLANPRPLLDPLIVRRHHLFQVRIRQQTRRNIRPNRTDLRPHRRMRPQRQTQIHHLAPERASSAPGFVKPILSEMHADVISRAMIDSSLCRVLRDVIPPTPPGPEGSNGNGLVWAQ